MGEKQKKNFGEESSKSYRFETPDGSEITYTVIHHGSDPHRLTPAAAWEVLRLLSPVFKGQKPKREAEI